MPDKTNPPPASPETTAAVVTSPAPDKLPVETTPDQLMALAESLPEPPPPATEQTEKAKEEPPAETEATAETEIPAETEATAPATPAEETTSETKPETAETTPPPQPQAQPATPAAPPASPEPPVIPDEQVFKVQQDRLTREMQDLEDRYAPVYQTIKALETKDQGDGLTPRERYQLNQLYAQEEQTFRQFAAVKGQYDNAAKVQTAFRGAIAVCPEVRDCREGFNDLYVSGALYEMERRGREFGYDSTPIQLAAIRARQEQIVGKKPAPPPPAPAKPAAEPQKKPQPLGPAFPSRTAPKQAQRGFGKLTDADRAAYKGTNLAEYIEGVPANAR